MTSTDTFNRNIDGQSVGLFKLTNKNGTQVSFTNYGCRIVRLVVADKKGTPTDVVVGFDSLEGYLTATEVYHGATIGRYANRIANGRFSLNHKSYELERNNGKNHLHGGTGGFHTKVWKVEKAEADQLVFSYVSLDGEEGYPGTLEVQVSFRLTENNELTIGYRAIAEKDTILNLTNHSYFNLNGQGNGPILNHTLQIFSEYYTPVNADLIPTGIAPVEGTPFDFRTPEKIGKRIHDTHPQLKYGNGYDHNYILNTNGQLKQAARAEGDKSGIILEVFTDQPGMQFYTGNFMSGENLIKGDVPDDFRTAFCLETQHYPDAPNHPEFPTVVVNAGQTFHSTTIYKFS
ncbi:MAG TPA: aldose epimerase family protein [Flavisolibacter sp.]|jgi:aldose 1-epimerase|nr:aldose epimerase family protein [Flavisolibacter sp.]